MSHFTVLVKIPPELLAECEEEARQTIGKRLAEESKENSLMRRLKLSLNQETNDPEVGEVLEDAIQRHAIQIACARQLAPFQENNMGDCPEEYLAFHPVNDGLQEEWDENEQNIEALIVNGETITRHSSAGDDLVKPLEDKVKKALGIKHWVGPDEQAKFQEQLDKELEAAGIQKTKIGPKEAYKTFALFVEVHHGYKVNDKTDQYGYWENPNATWDWWQIGGRWAGLLRTHVAATTGIRGSKSLLMDGNPYEKKDTHPGDQVDCAKIKDIDWEYFNDKAVRLARETYQQMKPLFDIVKAGGDYNDFIATQRTKEFEEKTGDHFWSFGVHSLLWEFGMRDQEAEKAADANDNRMILLADKMPDSEEEFIKNYKWHWEFGTYAVLEKNGKWIAKGEMGWWACSSETPDESQDWNMSFYDGFIRDEDPEVMLAVVDCHI